MRYKLLGRTGVRVSEIALGTGTFGTAWGWGSDRDASQSIFDAFAEAGGNFIDTASGYQDGQAEEFIGSFVKSDRANFVINTKYTGPPFKNPGVAVTGNSRKAMTTSIEASLKRLGMDYVDLYMVHFADGVTPIEEILRGFEDVVRAGKALYVGFSDFPAWRIARGATLGELRNLPVAAIQIEYSLAERTPERELLPMADALGLTSTLWSVMGAGLLSGKYRAEGVEGRLNRLGNSLGAKDAERTEAILAAIDAIAAETDAKPAQIAIAWARAKSRGRAAPLIPILGSRTLDQFKENLGALAIDLSSEQVERLDAASAITLGFPHDILKTEILRTLAFSGKYDQVDKPSSTVG
ncbi:MAG: aldo/keto reductase [Hyphomonadaceae bacterium]|nr:aldo/keto reductase [Hyphomonadaceae bacterium]